MSQLQASDTVAAAIRDYRKQRGWSVGDLAARCGLSRNVLSDIENGRRDGDGNRRRGVLVDELAAIARALEVDPGALLPEAAASSPAETLARAQRVLAREKAKWAVLAGDRLAIEEKIAEAREAAERQEEIIRRINRERGVKSYGLWEDDEA